MALCKFYSLKTIPNNDAIQCLDGSVTSSDHEKEIHIFQACLQPTFTLESKEDTPQLDDMAISPSMVCTVITKLKSEKSAGPNSWSIEVI